LKKALVISGFSSWRDVRKKLLFGLLGVAISVAMLGIPRVVDIDSTSYLLMAEGRLEEVVRPYSSRILHPMVASMIQRGVECAGFSSSGPSEVRVLEEKWAVSFWLLQGLSLMLFLVCVTRVVKDLLPDFAHAALFCTPVLALQIGNIYLPDLFFAALLAGWFLALVSRQRLIGALLLFLLCLTRESSWLVGLVYCCFTGWKRDWRSLGLGCCALVCGMFAVHLLTSESRANIHEIGGVTYLVMKMVANSLANFFGVTVWTNSYASMLPHFYPDPPAWKMLLPGWLQGGSVQEVGVYRFDLALPLRTVSALLSTFGLLTVLAWCWLRKEGWSRLKQLPDAFQMALIIGLAFFVLAPMSGRSIERLVGYAWPAFWLVVPLLGAQRIEQSGVLSRGRFWAGHLLVSWLPIFMRWF
jgi:hypothetical protein